MQALRIAPELDQGLRTVRVPDQGLRTVLGSRSFRRIDCRDSVLPQARERWEVRLRIVCRIKERAYRTAWRIGRTHWKTADPTSATACQTAGKIGNKIEVTDKTIDRIGETTTVKTGRTSRRRIMAIGITAVGIPAKAGTTCGTIIPPRQQSASLDGELTELLMVLGIGATPIPTRLVAEVVATVILSHSSTMVIVAL